MVGVEPGPEAEVELAVVVESEVEFVPEVGAGSVVVVGPVVEAEAGPVVVAVAVLVWVAAVAGDRNRVEWPEAYSDFQTTTAGCAAVEDQAFAGFHNLGTGEVADIASRLNQGLELHPLAGAAVRMVAVRDLAVWLAAGMD